MTAERLFLDANILVSAALTPAGTAARLWRVPDVWLVASPHVLGEARRNVRDAAADRLEALVASMAVLPTEPADFEVDGDPGLPEKDRPVLLGAIAARSHYLLTGDVGHFGHCMGRRIHGVLVTTPGACLRSRRP